MIAEQLTEYGTPPPPPSKEEIKKLLEAKYEKAKEEKTEKHFSPFSVSDHNRKDRNNMKVLIDKLVRKRYGIEQ